MIFDAFKELPQAGHLTWMHVPIGDLKDEQGKSVPSRIRTVLYGWWGNENAKLCKTPSEWNWDVLQRRGRRSIMGQGIHRGFIENSDIWKGDREGKSDVLMTVQQKLSTYSVRPAEGKEDGHEQSWKV